MQQVYQFKKFNTVAVTSTSPMNPLTILEEENKEGHTDATCSCDDECSDVTSGHYLQKACLSIPVNEVASNSAIPCDCLEGIWQKAASLASSSNVPGGNEPNKMVQSYAGSAPHHVKVRGPAQAEYVCDEKCPQLKSSHIRTHTVAAAETIGALAKFVCFSLKRHGKKPANLTKLALHDMP